MATDFSINVDQLDVEFAMLPRVYSEYSEKVELVDINLRRLKLKYDTDRAKFSKHIRSNVKEYCTEYSLNTLTEGFINTLLDSWPDLQRIQEQILELERDKRLLMAAVRSLEMKRDALKNLVLLYQSEYFSMSGIQRKMEDYQKAQDEFERRNIKKEIRMKIRESVASAKPR